MENKFVLKIIKDANGKEQNLNDISTSAINPLTVFLQSLSEIASSYDFETSISLNDGCIEASLIIPQNAEQITTDINDAFEEQSANKIVVRAFRQIQKVISANGLTYEANFIVDNEMKDVIEDIKAASFNTRRGPRKEYKHDIIFVKGKLYNIGGKVNSNIHVESNLTEYKISCNIEQAKKINKLLYEDVNLSVLKKWKAGEQATYEFIDYFIDEDIFIEFKNFYSDFSNAGSLKKHDILHEFLMKYILSYDEVRFKSIIKIMRLFYHKHGSRGFYRTILTTLKPIKNKVLDEQTKKLYDDMVNQFKMK